MEVFLTTINVCYEYWYEEYNFKNHFCVIFVVDLLCGIIACNILEKLLFKYDDYYLLSTYIILQLIATSN